MLARLSAFAIWALVAATAVFWGLRLFVSAPAAPAYAVAVGDAATVRGDLTRLLGSAPVAAVSANAAPEASSRFRLFGIVAPKGGSESTAAGRGVALIAVDGKMPKAYPVGSQIDGDLVLQTVSLRTASIAAGKGAPAITLELPRPLAAATGALSSAPIGGLPAAATGSVPTGAVVPPFVPQPIAPQVFQPVPVLAPSANATTVPMRPEVGSPTQ
jgi:general secretion pathway protein C